MSAPGDPAQVLRDRLTAHYRLVADTRMAGLPICNPALAVAAIGFDRMVGTERLGVLLTPWFMNAILLPQQAARETVGRKRQVQLPAGRFAFVAHDEPGLGVFWSCSLMSPVFELGDQATAMAAAEAAFGALLSEGDLPEEDERAIAAAWHGTVDPVPTQAARPETEAAEAALPEPVERPAPTRRAMLTLGRRANA